MKIHRYEGTKRSCSLSLYFSLSHPFLSLSFSSLSLVLSLHLTLFYTGVSTYGYEDSLSCGVEVLLAFLSYGFKVKERGKKHRIIRLRVPNEIHMCDDEQSLERSCDNDVF